MKPDKIPLKSGGVAARIYKFISSKNNRLQIELIDKKVAELEIQNKANSEKLISELERIFKGTGFCALISTNELFLYALLKAVNEPEKVNKLMPILTATQNDDIKKLVADYLSEKTGIDLEISRLEEIKNKFNR